MADQPGAPAPDPQDESATSTPSAASPPQPGSPHSTPPDPALAPSALDAASVTADAGDIDELLKHASFEDPSGVSGASAQHDHTTALDANAAAAFTGGAPNDAMSSISAEAFDLPNFHQAMAEAQVSSIDLLRDVELNVKIELGRSRMLVEDVLKLAEGSVVELDKLAGDPVDVFVNDRLVARGEVLVLNESFCVRVNEIVGTVRDDAY